MTLLNTSKQGVSYSLALIYNFHVWFIDFQSTGYDLCGLSFFLLFYTFMFIWFLWRYSVYLVLIFLASWGCGTMDWMPMPNFRCRIKHTNNCLEDLWIYNCEYMCVKEKLHFSYLFIFLERIIRQSRQIKNKIRRTKLISCIYDHHIIN